MYTTNVIRLAILLIFAFECPENSEYTGKFRFTTVVYKSSKFDANYTLYQCTRNGCTLAQSLDLVKTRGLKDSLYNDCKSVLIAYRYLFLFHWSQKKNH